jgi:hypothetical protein
LNTFGISYTSADSAIALGNNICNSINSGADFPTVQLNAMRWTNLPQILAARLIVASIYHFCAGTDENFTHQAIYAEF